MESQLNELEYQQNLFLTAFQKKRVLIRIIGRLMIPRGNARSRLIGRTFMAEKYSGLLWKKFPDMKECGAIIGTVSLGWKWILRPISLRAGKRFGSEGEVRTRNIFWKILKQRRDTNY